MVSDRVELPAAEVSHFLRAAKARLALLQLVGGAPSLRHIVKDEHRAGHLAKWVSDRRGAVLDWDLATVARDQRGVVGQLDDPRLAQHLLRDVRRLPAGLLVDEPQDRRDR